VGDSAADVSSIREILKKGGYSEKAIEEVLKWYDSPPKANTPQAK
jgi:hypothetical protein